jgi:hypothetical protein
MAIQIGISKLDQDSGIRYQIYLHCYQYRADTQITAPYHCDNTTCVYNVHTYYKIAQYKKRNSYIRVNICLFDVRRLDIKQSVQLMLAYNFNCIVECRHFA